MYYGTIGRSYSKRSDGIRRHRLIAFKKQWVDRKVNGVLNDQVLDLLLNIIVKWRNMDNE